MKFLDGQKYGCISLITGSKVCQQKEIIQEIAQQQLIVAEKKFNQSGQGFKSQKLFNLKYIERLIEKAETGEGYICQCKCGNLFYCPCSDPFLQKERRYCDVCSDEKDCGLRRKKEKKHPSYFRDFSGIVHDTLHVLECTDEHFEGCPSMERGDYPCHGI